MSADRRWLGLLFLALLAVPALAGNGQVLFLGVTFLINLILIASLNALLGFAGQISLCHAGLFGVGAYASGIAAARYGVSPWLGLGLGAMAAAAVALLVGPPALRLRGHYLAMATLGLNAILTVLMVQLVPWTGGPNGLLGVPPLALPPLGGDTATYLAAWAAAGAVMLGLLHLLHSRIGRALRAIAANEAVALAAGVDVARLKLRIFCLTAAMAGLAGALYVHANQFAAPETFGVAQSVLLLAMVALGGWGRYWGAVPGALLPTLTPELLRGAEDAELLIFGLGMVAVLLFFPGGLAGVPAALVRLVRRPT